MKPFGRRIAGIPAAVFTVILLAAAEIRGAKPEQARKKITARLKRKYPSCQIVSLIPEYTDWSSTVREADDSHRATSASAVIRNGEEQRTILLNKCFCFWRIRHDLPDFGPNVPEGLYFISDQYGTVGKRINITAYIRNMWIIPDETGAPYKITGGDYFIHYISNIYKTEGGRLLRLNPQTFCWEEAGKPYSELILYGTCTKASRAEIEEIIETNRRKRSETAASGGHAAQPDKP